MSLASITSTSPEQVSQQKKTLKPGAPISLLSPSVIQLKANQSSPVELHLQVLQKGRWQLQFGASDGLQLVATPSMQTLDVDNPGEIVLPLRLMAPADGRFYVHINAALETEVAASARHLAVAVQVGDAQARMAKPSLAPKQEDGEAVISLPAQETIKP
jgi:hypothetical protein